MTPSVYTALETNLKKAIRSGSFEIKNVLSRNRKFIKNYFEVVDEQLFTKLHGKNVCVMDDVISSGATQLEILRKTADYAPSNLFGTVIYKTGY